MMKDLATCKVICYYLAQGGRVNTNDKILAEGPLLLQILTAYSSNATDT